MTRSGSAVGGDHNPRNAALRRTRRVDASVESSAIVLGFLSLRRELRHTEEHEQERDKPAEAGRASGHESDSEEG